MPPSLSRPRPGVLRGLRATLVVLLASAVLGLVPAASGPAWAAGSAGGKAPKKPAVTPTVTFGIGPLNTTKVGGRSVLNYELQPGAQTTDHIVLVNLADKPVTLSVYTADALNNHDGSIGYQPKASPGDGSHTWITVDSPDGSTSVTVAARKTRTLPISIHVPTNATPGDHIAGVIASLTSKVINSNGERVNFEQRVALRTFFRVSGALRPQLSVEHLKATYHGTLNPFGSGRATVSFTVRNTGNINLGGRQRVTVTGLFGSTGSVRSLASIPVLLPGSSYPVRLQVNGIWPEIFMRAKVTVTPEGVAGAANPTLPWASASTGFRAVPWTLLVLIVALIALGVGYWLWRRAHPPKSARHRPPNTRTPVLSGKA